MAEYISGLDMKAFVLDYDHNAPSVEHLQETHYPFYEIIRKAQPDLPILMLSKPDFDGRYTEYGFEMNRKRRAVIEETLRRALENGDQKIRFIDGETFFGDSDRDSCTVDGCHPNDLGFFRMAEKVIPVLKEMLK
jgi:lysophospholipase L1-like esterase